MEVRARVNKACTASFTKSTDNFIEETGIQFINKLLKTNTALTKLNLSGKHSNR